MCYEIQIHDDPVKIQCVARIYARGGWNPRFHCCFNCLDDLLVSQVSPKFPLISRRPFYVTKVKRDFQRSYTNVAEKIWAKLGVSNLGRTWKISVSQYCENVDNALSGQQNWNISSNLQVDYYMEPNTLSTELPQKCRKNEEQAGSVKWILRKDSLQMKNLSNKKLYSFAFSYCMAVVTRPDRTKFFVHGSQVVDGTSRHWIDPEIPIGGFCGFRSKNSFPS